MPSLSDELLEQVLEPSFVAENEIAACLSGGGDVAEAQHKLKCGTGCGSCVPELKRLALKFYSRAIVEELAA